MTEEFYYMVGMGFNGPFKSAQEARDKAVAVLGPQQNREFAAAIRILQVIECGRVIRAAAQWVSDAPAAKVSKPLKNMTDDELSEELANLEKANEAATSWGAAVGARSESIKEIRREQFLRLNARNDIGLDTKNYRAVPKFKEPPKDIVEGTNSFSPWEIDLAAYKKWGEGSAVNHAMMSAFYKRVAADIFRLEPHVECGLCPNDDIRACYTSRAGEITWMLRIAEVPKELRICFPNLPLRNPLGEYNELPEWKKDLYWWDGTNYLLLTEHAAWHVEEE